jgi:hypothetical protein
MCMISIRQENKVRIYNCNEGVCRKMQGCFPCVCVWVVLAELQGLNRSASITCASRRSFARRGLRKVDGSSAWQDQHRRGLQCWNRYLVQLKKGLIRHAKTRVGLHDRWCTRSSMPHNSRYEHCNANRSSTLRTWTGELAANNACLSPRTSCRVPEGSCKIVSTLVCAMTT